MSFGYTKGISLASIVCAIVLFSISSAMPSQAGELYKVGTSESVKYSDALPVECPHPEIPPLLHEECYKSSCLARFCINCEGTHEVTLVSSSGNDEVDEIALKTLRRWKFKPAMLNGKPVQSVRKIKVEFEVE